MENIHIITVSGPSLSGKTEFTKQLKEKYGFEVVISHTTRPQRATEQNNKDYYFINNDVFDSINMVQTTNFNNFKYGVSENEILSKTKNKPVLWVIAPESINQVRDFCLKNNYKLTTVFVSNPEKVIFERLFKRFKEDKDAKIETYVNRLSSIVNNEKQWIEDAATDKMKYDVLINKFDAENSETIINSFGKLMNKTNTHKKLNP